MNTPIETNDFRHYLQFEGIGFDELYEICEPSGFDASGFVIAQESKRYARDTKYGAIEKLTFYNRIGKNTNVEQVINPQGETSTYLNYGLEWLLYGLEKYRFEFKAYYILRQGNTFAPRQTLDFTDKDLTDGYTYIKCKLIENNDVQNIKRRIDNKFNAFADKNAKQEVITPAPNFNFLRKATPTQQSSNFIQDEIFTKSENFFGNDSLVFNPCSTIQSYEIENTLTSFDLFDYINDNANTTTVTNAIQNRTIIKAKRRITNLTIKISGLTGSIFKSGQTLNIRIRVAYGTIPLTDWQTIDVFSSSSSAITFTNQAFPEVVIPILEIGQKVWFYFSVTSPNPLPAGSPIASVSVNILKTLKIDITATSTALDTIVKGVRWIDFIKQAVKYSSNLPVDAVLFESLGTHYDNAVFCKSMISQKVDSFYSTPKEVLESITEINCDYELQNDKVYIGHHSDFYTNNEIGVFQILPSEASAKYFNDRCMINSFKFGYKKYEQDRNTIGTSNAIHTESEWNVQNENVENTKDVKVSFVRDPFAMQTAVDLEINNPSTSTTDDDDVYIVQITNIAPGTKGGFGARLNIRVVSGRVQILNRDSEGDSSDVVINWLLLGFGIGDTFKILLGNNIGNYTVFSITASVLTLTPIGFTPAFSGDSFLSFEYPLTNVNFITRTTEGVALNPNKIQNVQYSIKRNMRYFDEYLHSCLLGSKKNIVNNYFKSNGSYQSRLDLEVFLTTTENALIEYIDLKNPLTTDSVFDLSLYADFNQILELIAQYKLNRGFIRCYDNNGRVLKLFIQNQKQNWINNQLDVTGEEKFSAEFITIVSNLTSIIVDDVVYDLNGFLDWWKVSNGLFQAFDSNNIPICNLTNFDKVQLNGIIYESENNLVDALSNL
jgi:hypothetical protein